MKVNFEPIEISAISQSTFEYRVSFKLDGISFKAIAEGGVNSIIKIFDAESYDSIEIWRPHPKFDSSETLKETIIQLFKNNSDVKELLERCKRRKFLLLKDVLFEKLINEV